MASNPSYVRLSDRMTNGMVADLDSGFKISGFDVQAFPESREAARFVRRKMNAGVIEPATQAEYSEAHPDDEESEDEAQARSMVDLVRAASGQGGGRQEHLLRQKEMGRHDAIRSARRRAQLEEEGVEVDDDADTDEMEYAGHKARREALAKEQEEDNLGTDDPEEQEERTATRAPKKQSGPKRRAESKS